MVFGTQFGAHVAALLPLASLLEAEAEARRYRDRALRMERNFMVLLLV
jgi:hypothetical protein